MGKEKLKKLNYVRYFSSEYLIFFLDPFNHFKIKILTRIQTKTKFKRSRMQQEAEAVKQRQTAPDPGDSKQTEAEV